MLSFDGYTFNHGGREGVDIISREEQIRLERQCAAAVRNCKMECRSAAIFIGKTKKHVSKKPAFKRRPLQKTVDADPIQGLMCAPL